MKKKFGKFLCGITGVPEYWVKSTLFEFRMVFIRLYGLLFFQKPKLSELYARDQSINLMFGCGGTSYDDWIGVDCFFGKNVDFVLDLRRPLPFRNGSIDLCFSEHFMEHLTQTESMNHLSEVFRVLKPGGVYRIVVPSAFRFIERYRVNDSAFFALAFPWADRHMDAVRDIIYFSGEHKNIYDLNEFRYLGRKAGFVEIKESSANCSDNLLLRIDKSDPQRVAESLYIEMTK